MELESSKNNYLLNEHYRAYLEFTALKALKCILPVWVKTFLEILDLETGS